MTRSWGDEIVERLDLRAGLAAALRANLELSNASLGNIQLMDWKARHLTIEAQSGFPSEFLDFFKCVGIYDNSACGRAIRRRAQVVVEDVTEDEQYASCRDIALRAGYRSVQSTPLISRSGAFVGMLSTHFPHPHRFSEIELAAQLQFAQQLANKIILHRVRTKTRYNLPMRRVSPPVI